MIANICRNVEREKGEQIQILYLYLVCLLIFLLYLQKKRTNKGNFSSLHFHCRVFVAIWGERTKRE